MRLSIGYLLLALEEAGLAPLTYTPPRVDWANELLGVHRNYFLQAIIPVGRPKGKKVKELGLSLEDITFCNGWGTGYQPAASMNNHSYDQVICLDATSGW